MATHKSAEKRHRQSLVRRERNRVARSAVRTAFKRALTAIRAKDAKANEICIAAERAMSKAAAKGIFARQTASRRIGRLMAIAKP